jgi:hypothetical protein
MKIRKVVSPPVPLPPPTYTLSELTMEEMEAIRMALGQSKYSHINSALFETISDAMRH